MTHPPSGRPVLFVGAAVAAIALFLGLAAGPASAGPEVGVRSPHGQSGDPGPKPNKGGDAQKKSDEGAKPGPADRNGKARPGQEPGKRPHEAKGPAAKHGGHHPGGPKTNSASHHEEEESDQQPLAHSPHQDGPHATPTVDQEPAPATTAPSATAAPIRNPDHDIRTLSNGRTGITTSLGSAAAEPAGSAPAAGAETEVTPPPDPASDGALGPPLLGAGPAPSRWAPFVPALDEPAFPAVLLAALGLFLALFGRGDRRDPKLVEAVVDDRAKDVDFS